MTEFSMHGAAFLTPALDRRSGARAAAHGPEHASARFVLLHHDKAHVEAQRLARFRRSELPAIAPELVFLGAESDGSALYAAQADAAPDGLPDLRSLAVGGGLEASELGIFAQARSLLSWHMRHRFCANCGGQTEAGDSGHKRACGSCGAEHFPRTDPVVILTVTRGDKILLGRGKQFPEGMYSALAGFMEPGENIEQAAARELSEETGIEAQDLRYVASQPWPFPSSLMIGLVGKAVNEDIRIDENEIADARWFSKADAEAMLAGTHPHFSAPKRHAIAHHLVRAALAGM